MTAPVAQYFLNATGLYCPEPVMLLHGTVRKALAGEVIHVLATDPSTTRDIPKFCHFLGHELILTRAEADQFEYWICKK
jgi:tRNA 2-thiouridine synthesizing protein A